MDEIYIQYKKLSISANSFLEDESILIHQQFKQLYRTCSEFYLCMFRSMLISSVQAMSQIYRPFSRSTTNICTQHKHQSTFFTIKSCFNSLLNILLHTVKQTLANTLTLYSYNRIEMNDPCDTQLQRTNHVCMALVIKSKYPAVSF